MRISILALASLLSVTVSALPDPRTFDEVIRSESTINKVLARSDLFARDDGAVDGFDDDDGVFCLTKRRAQKVADNFKELIANYSTSLADATLSPNYTDYSDSVNELINNGCTNGPIPLGSPTFTSRAAFEAAQGAQPPIPFQQLNIWHTCHAVTLRWYSAQTPQRVTGIIVLETVKAPASSKYKDLIKLVFSEFNSGAWMVNLGICKVNCS